VIRQRVDVPCVEDAKILDRDRGVAYFRLTSFQKTTSRDVDAALWRLHREGMKTLIVDVRGNPGGLLTASVEVADKFLYEGTIVATRGRNEHEDYDYKAHRVGTWGIPLIVLIDDETASASEIFAGAIRDHGRGTVIGETSYGKGSVQGIFPLSSFRSGVRMTTARFFTPNGHPISGRGVIPHQVVSQDDAHKLARPTRDGTLIDGAESDPVLATGLQSARQLNVAATR
jgi:carboxyl-terminal processing protease